MKKQEIARKYMYEYLEKTNIQGKEDAIKEVAKRLIEKGELEDFIRGSINIILDQDIILRHYESNMCLRDNDPIDLSKPYAAILEEMKKDHAELKKNIEETLNEPAKISKHVRPTLNKSILKIEQANKEDNTNEEKLNEEDKNKEQGTKENWVFS